ncbi:hypothetical protein B0W20_07470 [Bacillus spizizenii]|nr:hypothetical protein AX282_02115 [Bacillus spizizenii]OUL06971.1 hypothetical protein B0W20_07470 [Bacillus spizizenii]
MNPLKEDSSACRQSLAFFVRSARWCSHSQRNGDVQASCLNIAVITSCERPAPMLVLPRLQGFSITLK